MPYILWELPAVQVALLYRQWTFAVAGSKAITLQEEECFAKRRQRLKEPRHG